VAEDGARCAARYVTAARGHRRDISAMTTRVSIPFSELIFETSRAQGPGGQNVNKVETKVRLLWSPATSDSLTETQRARLRHVQSVTNRMNAEGYIVVESQAHRTQRMNREEAVKKLHALVNAALQPVKKRIGTKPTKGSKIRKKVQKQRRSLLKAQRRELVE
jgi:ribosome-associated protein